MYLFWRLFLAHLLADFTFQTNKIAEQKSKGLSWIAIHSLIFFILSLALSYEIFGKMWVYITITFLHFVVDSIRIIGIKKHKIADNVYFFGIDQVFHISIIYAFSKSFSIPISILPNEKWVLILCLYIIATHFAAVLIYYIKNFDEANIKGKEKYYGILERTYIFLCFLLPKLWIVLFPVIWIARFFWARSQFRNDYDFSTKNLITGNILVVITGIIARWIYYY